MQSELIDINSALPKVDKNKAEEILNLIKTIENGTNEEINSFQELYDTGDKQNQWIAKYAQETQGQIRSTEGVIKANKAARESAIAQNVAIQQQTLSAKAGQVALQGLAIAGNMIAMWAISKVIQLAVNAYDNYIHRVEKARERTSELFDEFKERNDTLAEHKKTVEELADRYDELSKGVNLSNNKNQSLSTDEYEEFLDINKQLANSFPSLSRGISENGSSILSLGTNGMTAKEQLEELLQTEEDLNNFRIADNLNEVFTGVLTYINKANETSKELSNIDTNGLMDEVQNIVDNGIDIELDSELGYSSNTGINLLFSGDTYDSFADEYTDILVKSAKDFFNKLNDDRKKNLRAQGTNETNLFDVVVDNDNGGTFEVYSRINDLDEGEIEALEKNIQENAKTLNGVWIDEFGKEQQKAQEAVQQAQNSWTDFIPNLVAGMKSKQTFKNLEDPDLQDIAVQIVEGLDSSYAAAMEEYNPDDPYAYIRDKFIVPMSELSASDKQLLENRFNALFKLDANDVSQYNKEQIAKYITEIADLLEKNQQKFVSYLVLVLQMTQRKNYKIQYHKLLIKKDLELLI